MVAGTSDSDRVSTKGRKVELTLQSIQGIQCKVQGTVSSIPEMTAAVSFAGSAANMQVSSFTMCSRTGNLVVESQAVGVTAAALCADCEDTTSSHISSTNLYPLVATFHDPRRSDPVPSNDVSVLPVSHAAPSQRPHLQLSLSDINPQVPKRSLTKVNRDARAVSELAQSPDMDGQSLLSTDVSRGASLHWEAEGAMPDIVEVHILLRNEDCTICIEGIAHLMLFGSQRELGTTTMDLLIKKKGQPDPNAFACLDVPVFSFADDACIRVQVEVTSEDQPVSHSFLSTQFNEKKIDNIMLKLKEHEEIAAAQAKAHKMNTPNGDQGSSFPRRLFCNAGNEMRDSFRAIMEVLTRCDGGRTGKRTDMKYFIPMLRTNSTMDSSIETRDSMLL